MLGRLLAQWRLKIRVCLGLAVGICVPYFGLQQVALFEPQTVPATLLDGWIAFDPSWVPAYESIALLVPLAIWLATRRDELLRYSRGLALLCGVSFACFLLVPVAGPRPALAPDDGMYQALVDVDAAVNAFPSLHAGLTVYSLLFAWQVVRDALGRAERRVFLAGACIWATVILYGTLATKQHWSLDLPAGMLLAWLAHRWAWQRP
jgi:membrane-associated phospholipid phosphatase